MKAKGKAAKEYRLQLVIKLHEQGYTQSKIGDQVGLSQSRVSEIIRQYRKDGASSLVIKSPPGLTPGLDSQDLEKLKELLKLEAKAAGFATDGWTLLRVKQLIEQHWNLSYSLEHVRRILKKINFTRQRPIAKDYHKDELAVEKWKTQTLPALKKSGKRRL